MENSDFIQQTHEDYNKKLAQLLINIGEHVERKQYNEAIALSSGLQASLGVLLFVQALEELETLEDSVKTKRPKDEE